MALLLCLLFIVTGCLWIDRPGIQNDESLFAAGIFEPIAIQHSIRIFKHDYPLMIMTYVGALKTLLYMPIFALWEPSAASARVPMVIVGAATVWLFYLFLLRVSGAKAALIGAALLATDTTYLWTIRCDWGPVTFQHFFLISGLLALVNRRVALGCFLFGLGMWDKALFIWPLAGIAAATLLVYPRQLWRELTWRRVALGALAFAAGAFPLIRYNVVSSGASFRGNAVISTEGLAGKLEVLRFTMNGAGFADWAARYPDRYVRGPRSWGEQIVTKISDLTGRRGNNWMLVAFVLAVAGLFTRARRPIAWGLVFLAVTFLQMAITKDTGGSLHHAILLWPIPVFVIALAMDVFPGRAAMALTAALCTTNLLATNEHHARFIRTGGINFWTSAIYPLTAHLQKMPAEEIVCPDWGYTYTVRMLGGGKLPLASVIGPFADADLNADDQKYGLFYISKPGNLFVTYTDDNEEIRGTNLRLRSFAAAQGYERTELTVIPDEHGRPVFELFRFVPKREGILTGQTGTASVTATSVGSERRQR